MLAGKQQLETAFHTQVSGYRAPCFRLDEEKLDIVWQLGLLRFEPDGFFRPRAMEASGHDDYRELRPASTARAIFTVQPVVPAPVRAELPDLRRRLCAPEQLELCPAAPAQLSARTGLLQCFICIRLSFRGSISRRACGTEALTAIVFTAAC